MYTFKITHDNKLIKELNNQESDFNVFKFLLSYQSQSIHWAIRYEGYKVEQIDEETKVSKFWKAKNGNVITEE